MAITYMDVIELSQQLIQKASVTPEDNGCQNIIADLLSEAGFRIIKKKFGDVENIFAWHEGENGKNLMFLGHTDVVASGDESAWLHPPFSATIDNELLYGRGAADMKSAVAAFVCAAIDFVKQNPKHKGLLSIMLTSDEEGVAINGINKMMPYIAESYNIDYCLVGEPSCSEQLGDVARIGRRGSLHAEIVIHGKQGHVAYPQKAVNPVFIAAPAIAELSSFQWDNGNKDFPPTSFQISSVSTSTNVSNIIPADLIIKSNFRFSPESTPESLTKQLKYLLNSHNLDYSLRTEVSGLPFYSTNNHLKSAIKDCISKITGQNVEFNTAGGTSDGRFVAPFGVDVVEFGLINNTIHQINEHVLIQDIINLERIYIEIISNLLKAE